MSAVISGASTVSVEFDRDVETIFEDAAAEIDGHPGIVFGLAGTLVDFLFAGFTPVVGQVLTVTSFVPTIDGIPASIVITSSPGSKALGDVVWKSPRIKSS